MQKKDKGASDSIAVTLSRFGSDPIAVAVSEGATVAEVLEKAGLSLSGREEIFVAGEKADMEDVVEDKDVLSIVTPKQAGSN